MNNGSERKSHAGTIFERLFSWYLPSGKTYATTLRNGSTVLDLEKARESEQLKDLADQLAKFDPAAVRNNGNGSKNHRAVDPKTSSHE